VSELRPARRAYGWGAMLLAWLSGFSLGVLAFLLITLWLA
jgi:hypothetical protein